MKRPLLPKFRDLPIRRKLFALIFLTSSVSALVVSGLLISYQLASAPREELRQIESLADAMALVSINAMTGFNDTEMDLTRALEKVKEVRLSSTILTFTIYDVGEDEIAGAAMPASLPEAVPSLPALQAFCPRGCSDSTLIGMRHYMWVQRPLFFGEEKIGTIKVLAYKTPVDAGAIVPGIISFLISLIVGGLLARRYQGTLSNPVEALARAAADVAARSDYKTRVPCAGSDEIGALTFSFNAMLQQIEQREAELERKNEELREANLRAEAASEAKSTFLAKVSHELRTPLTSIIGFSEYHVEAGLEKLKPQMAFGDLEKIHSSGKHLLHLINALLDLAKIEAGKMTLDITPFGFPALMREIGIWLEREMAKQGNRLSVRLSPTLDTLATDERKLQQILLNLLNNANKFTQNGAITVEGEIEMRDGREFLRLRISDTGIGIPPDKLENLFLPFYTGGYQSRHAGTGLGLTISRQFAQLMGGDITVTSTVGTGSTFTVVIPVSAVAHPEEPRTAPRAANVVGLSRRKVLVVDDDSATRELIQRIVGPEGFEVVQATTGEEGLRLARETKPDVIILDVILPGMNGWSVLTAIKADAELSAIPVLLLTILDDRTRGYALGASDFLVKPIDRERLVAATRKYRSPVPPSTVLVVDDDADSRSAVRKMLERDHWAVVEAENGNVALEWLRQNQPALILLDLIMPEMDGFRFVEEKRRRHGDHPVPVVVLTAKDMSAEERNQLSGGVDEILQKGAYTSEQFDRTIRSLVATYGPGGGAA